MKKHIGGAMTLDVQSLIICYIGPNILNFAFFFLLEEVYKNYLAKISQETCDKIIPGRYPLNHNELIEFYFRFSDFLRRISLLMNWGVVRDLGLEEEKILNVYMFGSRVYGTATEDSDWDSVYGETEILISIKPIKINNFSKMLGNLGISYKPRKLKFI